jgi:hypothetical protein
MPEPANPDYVDRCIDYVSSSGRRCIADLVLCTLLIGAVSLWSIKELDADFSQPAYAKSDGPTGPAQAVEICKRSGGGYAQKRASPHLI